MTNLLEAMQKRNPERNAVFNAIDCLQTPEDIKKFMKEYENWMLINNSGIPAGHEIQTAQDGMQSLWARGYSYGGRNPAYSPHHTMGMR